MIYKYNFYQDTENIKLFHREKFSMEQLQVLVQKAKEKLNNIEFIKKFAELYTHDFIYVLERKKINVSEAIESILVSDFGFLYENPDLEDIVLYSDEWNSDLSIDTPEFLAVFNSFTKESKIKELETEIAKDEKELQLKKAKLNKMAVE